MVDGTLIKISFLLSVLFVPLTLSKGNQTLCFKTPILETTGDIILTVFVDAYYGQECNVSSSKGLQQMTTALQMMQTLNKYNDSGSKLGLRMFDTCHDGVKVFKRILQMSVDRNCAPEHKMGILVPYYYASNLDFLRNQSDLLIITYGEQKLTEPLIDILVRYLSTRYQTVDLVLANTDLALDRFLGITRDAGVCVKSYGHNVNVTDVNVAEPVIVAIGDKGDIQRWLHDRERPNKPRKKPKKTWILLPLDNSDIDDLVPIGSYVIRPEAFSTENLEYTLRQSAYLLDIGRAIVELTEVLQDLPERDCPDDEDVESCIASRFHSKSRQAISNSDVYEALHMEPSSHLMKYAVAMKIQDDLVDLDHYEIEVQELRVLPEGMPFGTLPELCLHNLIENCENCMNFQNIRKDNGEKILKSGIYTLVFLIAIAFGILVCCIAVVFIVYRFTTKTILDGNPAFAIVLILANMFTLLTALFYCMTDDYFGAESLNAQKIFLSTLAFGFTFSIMLSRTLFLALSTSGVYLAHINGYLQSLMAFFMFSVQVTMSTMYFVLNTTNSAVIFRSPVFIALLGYDIFLLISLLVTSCFITRVQRNYYEGKCLLGTAIGLTIIWTVWPICFLAMQPEDRDTIVSFGTIGTVYSIILGIFIPKIYSMVVYPCRRKTFAQEFDGVCLPTTTPAVITNMQPRPLYNYAPPGRESQVLRVTRSHTDYYINANSKYPDRCGNPIQREIPAYSNYGFHEEMGDVNKCRNVPQACLENAQPRRKPEITLNEATYARPRGCIIPQIVPEEKECTSSRDNILPTITLKNEKYPMRYVNRMPTNYARRIDEEDEEDERDEGQDQVDNRASQVTRF